MQKTMLKNEKNKTMAYLHGVSPWFFFKKNKVSFTFCQGPVLTYWQKKNLKQGNVKPSTSVLLKCQGREDCAKKWQAHIESKKLTKLIFLQKKYGHNTFGLIKIK